MNFNNNKRETLLWGRALVLLSAIFKTMNNTEIDNKDTRGLYGRHNGGRSIG